MTKQRGPQGQQVPKGPQQQGPKLQSQPQTAGNTALKEKPVEEEVKKPEELQQPATGAEHGNIATETPPEVTPPEVIPPVDPPKEPEVSEETKAALQMIAGIQEGLNGMEKLGTPEAIRERFIQVAQVIGLDIRTKLASKDDRKWKTAQEYYDHMVARTSRATDTYNKLHKAGGAQAASALTEAVKQLVQRKEFDAETVDFTSKGRERLLGEAGRMIRKFAKDIKVDYEKVIKVVEM